MSAAVQGRLVNVTIDDQSPSLFYSNLWGDGGSCLSCLAAPNASQAIHETWHDSTHYADDETNPYPTPNVSTSFNGTAIYVICILPRTPGSVIGSSDMSFYIDSDLVGDFVNNPSPGERGFDYNYTVYSNTSIPPGQHRFTLQNGRVGASQTLTLFDAIVYSYDDGQPDHNNSDIGTTTNTSTAQNTSFIVGLALVVALAMFLGVVAFILYWRHRKHTSEPNHSHPPITPFFLGDPHTQTVADRRISLSPRLLGVGPSRTGEAPPSYELAADKTFRLGELTDKIVIGGRNK
ncbi:hypothetical protein ARMGADRAFT_1080439 [Armillaria gallica]|uniref:Uncharacterized protein n=1 Tax=Armillaria gallica TaxID=47427 RepID=A0A2H3DPA1_ARMGA|nr:hypothetical protein ARMGADRAFT_1080439 [Armillaria gallica]